MPYGYHPDLIDGAAIGLLIPRLPAIGNPTITVTQEIQGEQEGETQLIEYEVPNPDYVSSDDATITSVRIALTTQGINVFCSTIFFSGTTEEEITNNQVRVVVQCLFEDDDGTCSEYNTACIASNNNRRSLIDDAIVFLNEQQRNI